MLCRNLFISGCVGLFRQLIQIPGDAFQLCHIVEMLPPDALFYSSVGDQSAHDFGRLFAGSSDQFVELCFVHRVEPDTHRFAFISSVVYRWTTAPLINMLCHYFQLLNYSGVAVATDHRELIPLLLRAARQFLRDKNTNLPFYFRYFP